MTNTLKITVTRTCRLFMNFGTKNLTPEIIANSPLCVNVFRITWIYFNLLAQSSDMYIYRSCISRILISPDNIQKTFPAVNLVRIHCKKLQKIKFFCGKIQFPVPGKNSPAFTVDLQISLYHNFTARAHPVVFSDPTHDCLHSGLNLKNVERLCDVIICAIFQPEDLVHILALRSEHDDRYI